MQLAQEHVKRECDKLRTDHDNEKAHLISEIDRLRKHRDTFGQAKEQQEQLCNQLTAEVLPLLSLLKSQDNELANLRVTVAKPQTDDAEFKRKGENGQPMVEKLRKDFEAAEKDAENLRTCLAASDQVIRTRKYRRYENS